MNTRELNDLLDNIEKIPYKSFQALPGKEICSIMKMSGVTIRTMAKVSGLTMKRIRQLRRDGVDAGIRSWEIHWMANEARRQK